MSGNIEKLLKTRMSSSSICLVWMLKGLLANPLWSKSLSSHFNGYAIWTFRLVTLKIMFDMACLLMNSSIVRRKVFKPYKTKKFTIILTILLSFSGADCPTGFIGYNHTDREICCRPTSCSPGTFVQPCQQNLTSDVCQPCEPNSYLLDSTNSSFPYPCIKANCPPEATMSASFPRSGCRLRCKCDEARGYFGEDPCKCKGLGDKTNKERKEQADYEKMQKNIMSPHNHKQIKLVFTVVVITTGLIILIWCLYMYLTYYRVNAQHQYICRCRSNEEGQVSTHS